MFKLVRRLPWFRVLAIAKVALRARRHLKNLTPEERRRMAWLARRGRSLAPAERDELRALVGKLDARAFAITAADAFSPWPIGRLFR
jgi:hypothetical protein